MSEQSPRSLVSTSFCITAASALHTRRSALLNQLPSLEIKQPLELELHDLYFLEGDLTPQDMACLAALICDPVTDHYTWRRLGERVEAINEMSVIEVAWRPGVTDNTANQLLRAAHQSGILNVESVATGQRYSFRGQVSTAELHQIAQALLVNDTVQRYVLGEIVPEFVHAASTSSSEPARSRTEIISLQGLDEAGLLSLSQERRLALDANEMRAIQAYFEKQGRAPTDAELETLAQTWSEHCVHKTFKALITQDSGEQIDGLLKSTIMAATQAIGAEWVRSAFVDNAGVIAFDDEFDLSFKVETHNHPSAIEPFGGANTGVGGVVRDVLGVSHRPIAVTDVLCFGPADQSYENLPQGVLHPRRIRSGVIAGVGDYGNKLGLATVNGAVLYHLGYTANPLVYCGCVGIGPRQAHARQAQAGDRVIVIGGRTGRDGLRGATFSSLTMDAQTGQVAGASVQIGDPITEKGVIEVVERLRDAGLYHAITDCGAGGLSSAVGEMSAETGVRVDLLHVPLKYAGLAPWEIWLSEAQERMVLAVPSHNLPQLQKLCEMYEVEWQDIGEFVSSGRLQVFYGDEPVVDLEEDFLHHGIPRLSLKAASAQTARGETLPAPAVQPLPGLAEKARSLLLRLLAHPNIASKEETIRRYDHEVRGSSVIKPFAGPQQNGPSDAAVLKPLDCHGWKGFALANGINPWIGEVDPYLMAFSVVDEAIRNAVAVGADPTHLALLDNFCWGDPRRPETLESLVQAAQGCRDAAIYYRTPFISGKDSLNNEYLGSDGQRHAIPGTLLISSLAIVPDVRRCVTMDLKSAGNRLYLVGDFQPGLAGSHACQVDSDGILTRSPGLGQTPKPPAHAPQVYQALHTAIQSALVRSAHDLSEGGLGVAAAEMALSGRCGLRLDLACLPGEMRLTLFGETNGCLLVEVASEHHLAFEALFTNPSSTPPLPCQAIGETLSSTNLEILTGENEKILISIDDLLAAFKPAEDSLN